VAIVTGGAVRIGREIVLSLARAGMHVCVHYHSSESCAQQTVKEAQAVGVRAMMVPADLRQPQQAASTVLDAVCATFGRVDVLINSASIFRPGSLAELSQAEWDDHQRVNLEAPVWLSRAFAARITAHETGSIVNMLDWRGGRPQPGHLAYTVSKVGLWGVTTILAQELAPRIRVNGIAPGAVLPASTGGETSFARLAEVIPLQRTGSPADVAEAVLFLLRSDFISGEVIHVTGGQELAVPAPAGQIVSSQTLRDGPVGGFGAAGPRVIPS
jgi:NAD(P)-dependent dehydrogenase (short-subunit alcohol dehydrogenase family)